MKVLVVEDVPVSRMIFHRGLQRMGYEPTIVRNGEEALCLLSTERFDIVLTDWMMPIVDGPELVRAIRKLKTEHYIYIMFVTRLDKREFVVEGLRAGADDFVTKPVDSLILEAKLEVATRAVRRTCSVCGSRV